MNITISEHAKNRMLERGISKEQINEIFEEENWILSETSLKDSTAQVVAKEVNGKTWYFIFNSETHVLVTCYPRRKQCTKA